MSLVSCSKTILASKRSCILIRRSGLQSKQKLAQKYYPPIFSRVWKPHKIEFLATSKAFNKRKLPLWFLNDRFVFSGQNNLETHDFTPKIFSSISSIIKEALNAVQINEEKVGKTDTSAESCSFYDVRNLKCGKKINFIFLLTNITPTAA